MNRIAKNLRAIRDAYKKGKIKSRLGIEASGRQEVVGSLDEILTLVKNAKGILPVLNFAHVHARGFGLFKRPEDFDDVLSKVEKASDGGHIHAHFRGVEHADGNELRYTPIKKGDLRFEPLAECLLDDDYILTSAKKLFVYGVGRSGLAARAFAMRMVQLGIDCYFIGETITPVVSDGDAVLIVSNTGSTMSAIQVANIARRVGAKVISVTGNRTSKLGHASNVVLLIHADEAIAQARLAPLGTLFEDATVLLLDGLVAQVMERLGQTEADMRGRHAIMV